jgi:hypothetical protein
VIEAERCSGIFLKGPVARFDDLPLWRQALRSGARVPMYCELLFCGLLADFKESVT